MHWGIYYAVHPQSGRTLFAATVCQGQNTVARQFAAVKILQTDKHRLIGMELLRVMAVQECRPIIVQWSED